MAVTMCIIVSPAMNVQYGHFCPWIVVWLKLKAVRLIIKK